MTKRLEDFDDPLNPGVDVVRFAAWKIAEECGHDIDRYFERIMARQEEEKAKGRVFISTPFPPHDLAA
jgi:hypothetical protein